jgi:hypothetical protein
MKNDRLIRTTTIEMLGRFHTVVYHNCVGADWRRTDKDFAGKTSPHAPLPIGHNDPTWSINNDR